MADEAQWSYRRKLILAPMVRINSLAFRDLCTEHGCDMVYSEEIVARCLIQSKRSENTALGTIDFIEQDQGPSKPGGRLCFRTRPGENVVLQLGTACAVEALQAANCAVDCVRAVDLNMGCPVKFSVQGGMGSALLTEPEKVRDILTTLRRNLPASTAVTCKIRLLEEFKDTLQLAQLIESCGVQALAVHARRKHHRPRHWAQWDQFRLLRDAMPSSLPLILNGDVFTPADVPRALEYTKADSLMIARGALWNPSIFAADVVSRYVDLCEQHGTPVGNVKYTAMLMLEGGGKTEPFQLFQRAKTAADLRAAAVACKAHAHFTQPGGAFVPASLEPPPDIPDAPSLDVNTWRRVPKGWKPGEMSVRRAKAPINRAAPVMDAKRAAAAAAKDAAAATDVNEQAPPSGGQEVSVTASEPPKPSENALRAAAPPPAGEKRSFDQISPVDG